MNNSAKALVLEVGFIAHEEVGYSREFDFEFPHLNLEQDLEIENLTGTIVASRNSNGVLTQGKFNAETNANCGRCLEPLKQTLKTEFSEQFTLPNHADKDTELVLPHNGKIDFTPILREYMLLEIPINPHCREDCKGLCPECGINRNDETCNCETDHINPRFAALGSLLNDELNGGSGAKLDK